MPTQTIMGIIAQSRSKRLANVPPHFWRIHICSQCKKPYYCPDRYDFTHCGPSQHLAQTFGTVNPSFGCLPCMAQVTPEERAAWYEAHGVGIPLCDSSTRPERMLHA